MDRRPRIGIPMRIELPTDRFYLSRYYSEAVEAAGGAPVHISLIPKPDYINSVADGLDGILLIDAAERKQISVFAICFGMQILNVSRGGTLIQDIESQVPEAIKHEQGAPRDRASHRINVAQKTR